MTERLALLPESRTVLAVGGPDRVTFLQGLVSNDVARAGAERAIWSAFLTPQGKYLHDFFLVGEPAQEAATEERLLLDAEAARAADLLKRLKIYKLRSKVEVAELGEERVVALAFGADALAALGLPETPGAARAWGGGVAFVDPRLAALGARLILPRETARAELEDAGFAFAELADWDRRRLALGLTDGTRDLEVDKTILLEAGFDELGGVDWQKGCWMGQELTARTKYRGLIKRRLLPVSLDRAVEDGTPVTADGKEVGSLRSVVAEGSGARGLALLRLDALDAEGPLIAGEATVVPEIPGWAAVQRPARADQAGGAPASAKGA